MEKSEKAKQLRALRKYGKKVRSKVCGHRVRPSVVRLGCQGQIWFRALCVFRLVLSICPQRSHVCSDP